MIVLYKSALLQLIINKSSTAILWPVFTHWETKTPNVLLPNSETDKLFRKSHIKDRK